MITSPRSDFGSDSPALSITGRPHFRDSFASTGKPADRPNFRDSAEITEGTVSVLAGTWFRVSVATSCVGASSGDCRFVTEVVQTECSHKS